MKKSAFPARLWDYYAEYQANIRCHTDHDIPTLNGQVPKTVVTGNTEDISELVKFGWYQWIYYRDDTTYFPLPEEELGIYLWPSANVGSKMITWILKQNGKIVSRKTLRTLTDYEIASETKNTKRVPGGHTTNPPTKSTYAGVVSRESIRISFNLAALNDHDHPS